MKKLIILSVLMLASGAVTAQHENHQEASVSAEVDAVKTVLKQYKDALESLDLSNTQHLFSQDATIFENGKYEGSYRQYLDNHIGPELGHFKEFTFSNYTVNVRMEDEVAVAYETYNYRIVIGGEEDRIVERQAVATSVLKKLDGTWKIIQNHGSSRAIRN